ncbi:hypothetical protein EH223_05970 [candidate division KSB1 bacterium]|nr:RecX family transcriptional regulator [candidate division KSB1 bacterium]RQW05146.1 MAG: hypothetical protein EH223_05970 [candidate division KSB1 bacterium]
MTKTRTITDITPQEKRKDRFSIFLDGEFAFGLHQDVLLKSGIARGDELAEQHIETILQLEQQRAAKEKAYRLLAVRPRSKKELSDRLKLAGFNQNDINWVLDELVRLKLLNDTEFALMFAKNRMITKPCGPLLLRQELTQKGISPRDIAHAIHEVYSEKSEYVIAREAAIKNKKKQVRLDEDKAKKRVTDFLMRRGFNWDIVNDIVENWDNL